VGSCSLLGRSILTWFVIWTFWGVVSGFVAGWQGGERRILGPALVGGILGAFGAWLGQRYLGAGSRRSPVLFWAGFWAAFWAVWFVVPVVFLGAISATTGGLAVDLPDMAVQAALQGAAVGAIGGLIGGAINSRLTPRP
jgi:hypothetical protein